MEESDDTSAEDARLARAPFQEPHPVVRNRREGISRDPNTIPETKNQSVILVPDDYSSRHLLLRTYVSSNKGKQYEHCTPELLGICEALTPLGVHIDDLVGEGGTSWVFGGEYGGHDVIVKLGKELPEITSQGSLKYVSQHQDHIQHEATVLRDLGRRTSAVVPLLGSGTVNGRSYEIFEKQAFDLESVLQHYAHKILNDEPFCSEKESWMCASMVPHLLEQIAAIHAAGYVHRDLKPSNILSIESLRWGWVIGDFATARRLDELVDYGGHSYESQLYASPEQIRAAHGLPAAPISFTTDIYSLGLIIARFINPVISTKDFPTVEEKLTGAGHAKRVKMLADKLPDIYRPVVKKCLRYNPAWRYRSVERLRSSYRWRHVYVGPSSPTRMAMGWGLYAAVVGAALTLGCVIMAADAVRYGAAQLLGTTRHQSNTGRNPSDDDAQPDK